MPGQRRNPHWCGDVGEIIRALSQGEAGHSLPMGGWRGAGSGAVRGCASIALPAACCGVGYFSVKRTCHRGKLFLIKQTNLSSFSKNSHCPFFSPSLPSSGCLRDRNPPRAIQLLIPVNKPLSLVPCSSGNMWGREPTGCQEPTSPCPRIPAACAPAPVGGLPVAKPGPRHGPTLLLLPGFRLADAAKVAGLGLNQGYSLCCCHLRWLEHLVGYRGGCDCPSRCWGCCLHLLPLSIPILACTHSPWPGDQRGLRHKLGSSFPRAAHGRG